MRRSAGVLLSVVALLVALPADAEKRYIAFGDSITDGFGDPEGAGYPKRLRKILQDETGEEVKIVKSAVVGESTSEALSRVSKALAGGGDAFLLMEGTNDVTFISQGYISLETVTQNLESLALSAQRKGIVPIHATIFPRSPKARRDRGNVLTQLLVREIRKLAYTHKRKLVDIYEAFDPEIVENAFELYYFSQDDAVGHPNVDGYKRIARGFADVMQEIDNTPPVVGPYLPGPLLSEVTPDTEFRVPIYETVGASGVNQKHSTLTINGRAVGDWEGNRRWLQLTFQDQEAVGCRVVLGVRSQDRANPPNVMERVLGVYDLTDRSVLVGDVDFDCYVGGADLVSLAWAFGAEIGDERYQRRLDLNIDGIVDDLDLALFSKTFSRSSL